MPTSEPASQGHDVGDRAAWASVPRRVPCPQRDKPVTTAGQHRATRLTADQIAGLRVCAGEIAATDGGFVDPHRLRVIEGWWRSELQEWATAILGRPFHHRHILWRGWILLDLAHDLEPDPPPPPVLTARRAIRQTTEDQAAAEHAAQHAAELGEWATLATTLPVPVAVAYNYSGPHHYEGHTSGASHIILLAPLHVGRLHRDTDQPLCWTPARARHLAFAKPYDDPSTRIPTCKACLQTAARLTREA